MGTVIMTIESTRARLRPRRSPRLPKKAPPAMRMRDPAAKTPRLAIADTIASSEGKKSGDMTGTR